MFKIQTLNNIASKGIDHFPLDHYDINDEQPSPDAIILRSQNIHDLDVKDDLKAIARAGAGTNNIPIEKMSELGIPVFNTPGANANAVKELVISGMLLASRNICQSWDYVRGLTTNGDELNKQVEKGKKQFAGFELVGRKLGVIGLGAIGVKVANVALDLGMEVVGYDPKLTVNRAWELSSQVQQAESIEEVLREADFITFHVPLIPATKNTLNAERIQLLKPNAVILNFARGGIVDEDVLLQALNRGQKITYVSDFPSEKLLAHENVISLPHLGASTAEAEENCAVMAVKQIRDYLEHGNIVNSVNFPKTVLPEARGARIGIVNANVPNMVGQISTAFAEEDLNILDLLNKSRDNIAYTLVDLEKNPTEEMLNKIGSIEGVLSVRLIHQA